MSQRTQAEPSGVRFTATAGTRSFNLFMREAGTATGPAVLFLHGFPTSSLDWSKITPRFTDVRGLFPDLLGYGYSDKPRITYSYPLQADLVSSVMVQLGIKRLSIAAHDYSVTLAQELLLREQQRRSPFAIDHVVFLNGGVYGALHRPLRIHKILLTPVLGGLAARRMKPAGLAAGLNRIAGQPDAWTSEDAEDHWRVMAACGGLGRLPRLLHYIADRKANGPAWEGAMETARDKLGFVWGPADPVSGAHVIEQVRRRLPDTPITALDGVGHYPHWEAPECAAAAIRQSLGLGQ